MSLSMNKEHFLKNIIQNIMRRKQKFLLETGKKGVVELLFEFHDIKLWGK